MTQVPNFLRMAERWRSAGMVCTCFRSPLTSLQQESRSSSLSTPRWRSDPVWTPDGREIIFSSGDYGSRGLWRIAVSGSGRPQRLADVGEEGDLPTISRGRGRLVYTRQSQDVNIWQVQVGDRDRKPGVPFKLISSTRTDIYPDFSPQGERIAFQSDRSGVHEIWICETDGSRTVQLTSFNSRSGTPRWSPDGSSITFDSNVEGNFEIYVMSANGGKPKRMT